MEVRIIWWVRGFPSNTGELSAMRASSGHRLKARRSLRRQSCTLTKSMDTWVLALPRIMHTPCVSRSPRYMFMNW